MFTVALAAQRDLCRYCPQGHTVHKVVKGYPVIVTRNPGGQTLCAADAGGLSVTIHEFGNHRTVDVVSLFAHHLQLLGTNPAHWATRPIR